MGGEFETSFGMDVFGLHMTTAGHALPLLTLFDIYQHVLSFGHCELAIWNERRYPKCVDSTFALFS